MTKQKGICQECKKEYEYDYNPEYPRKYCPECSAKKKAEYLARPEEVPKEDVDRSHGPVPIERPHESKTTTMYVSYAKDIFVALVSHPSTTADNDDIMKKAIELVKQARAEF